MTERNATRRRWPRVRRQVRRRVRRVLRAFGPAMARGKSAEGLRAGIGIALGLLVTGYLFHSELGLALGVEMIAPFGATALLVFGVPNSPLAQPWSAIVGNTVSALVGVGVVLLTPEPLLAVPLAAGLSLVAMGATRSMHPPGAAVALSAAMNPDAVATMGFRFALAPVAAGTAALVLVAIVYTRATGRMYPFRQADAPNPQGTADPSAMRRLGLPDAELAALLREFRQSTNVGVEDLARLIEGAETRAAARQLGRLTCADIMSRDLVTVMPHVSRAEVAAVFSDHGFHALPVVGADGSHMGMIFQIDVVRSVGQEDLLAADLMRRGVPPAAPDTEIGALIPLLALGDTEAAPVLDAARRLVGIVTRTDLIAALARRLATEAPDGMSDS